MKPIPTLESTSTEYSRLMSLHASLMKRDAEISEQRRALHAEAGKEQPANRHTDRVASLLTGVDYSPPMPIKDKLAELHAEQRAITEALRELSDQIKLERGRASRVVVGQFDAEHRELAVEFFKGIAAAAAAHAKYGELLRNFYRAGVDPGGFLDFGEELFGEPCHRNSEVGIAMRAAVRRGYLSEKQTPEAYR